MCLKNALWKLTLWNGACVSSKYATWGLLTSLLSKVIPSESRVRGGLMPLWCQTCAFYLVTRQPRCFTVVTEPAGNVLLHYQRTTASSRWNVLTSSVLHQVFFFIFSVVLKLMMVVFSYYSQISNQNSKKETIFILWRSFSLTLYILLEEGPTRSSVDHELKLLNWIMLIAKR